MHTVDRNPEKIIKVLKDTPVDLLTWFRNTDKCHSLVNSKEKVCAKIRPCGIQSSKQQKLLEVLIDNKG